MKKMSLVVSMLLLLCAPASWAASREYPVRDITNVITWAAGGGTDVINRVVTGEMAKILKVNINVVNKPGGAVGSIAMNDVYSRPHDGYTWVGVADANAAAGIQGGWDKKMEVWDFFIAGGAPVILSVTPNAPYKDLKELIEAAKAKPGTIRTSASGAGTIQHFNLLYLEKGSGAKFNFIPYPGSAPSQSAAMTGEVTVCITTIAEQLQLLRAKKLRPLALIANESVEDKDMGKIPSIFSFYPELKKYLPLSQMLGFAIAADCPENVKKIITDTFNKAMATDTVKNWAASNYYTLTGKTGAAAKNDFNRIESIYAWTLWEMGAAKVNPETLKIPKP